MDTPEVIPFEKIAKTEDGSDRNDPVQGSTDFIFVGHESRADNYCSCSDMMSVNLVLFWNFRKPFPQLLQFLNCSSLNVTKLYSSGQFLVHYKMLVPKSFRRPWAVHIHHCSAENLDYDRGLRRQCMNPCMDDDQLHSGDIKFKWKRHPAKCHIVHRWYRLWYCLNRVDIDFYVTDLLEETLIEVNHRQQNQFWMSEHQHQ